MSAAVKHAVVSVSAGFWVALGSISLLALRWVLRLALLFAVAFGPLLIVSQRAADRSVEFFLLGAVGPPMVAVAVGTMLWGYYSILIDNRAAWWQAGIAAFALGAAVFMARGILTRMFVGAREFGRAGAGAKRAGRSAARAGRHAASGGGARAFAGAAAGGAAGAVAGGVIAHRDENEARPDTPERHGSGRTRDGEETSVERAGFVHNPDPGDPGDVERWDGPVGSPAGRVSDDEPGGDWLPPAPVPDPHAPAEQLRRVRARAAREQVQPPALEDGDAGVDDAPRAEQVQPRRHGQDWRRSTAMEDLTARQREDREAWARASGTPTGQGASGDDRRDDEPWREDVWDTRPET